MKFSQNVRASLGRPQRAASIWKAPSILAIVTAAGLITALLNDGAYDVVSWLLLSLPLITAIYFLVRSRKMMVSEQAPLEDEG